MTEEFVSRSGKLLIPIIASIALAMGARVARAETSAPQAQVTTGQATQPPQTNAAAIVPASAPAEPATQPMADSLPPGTTITMQNWQQFEQYMPDGMVALFQGKYYWKTPADVKMEVGPTILRPLPNTYLEATEKYSG